MWHCTRRVHARVLCVCVCVCDMTSIPASISFSLFAASMQS